MYPTSTSTVGASPIDSKFTVAGILSSMANGHGLSPFSDPGPSFAGSLTSITTPVLTPTTLANLEQTFIELTSVPSQANSGDLITVSSQLPTDLSTQGAVPRQSGFVPPVVDLNVVPKTEPFYHDESSSDPEWYPSAKRIRTSVSGSAIVIAPDCDSTTSGRRKTSGPRRSRNEHLSPEEDERRRLRRERNKLAAAKCRQRRVDQTNTLINETEVLEDEKASLETEVESLQQVKEHLEFVLEAHRPLCTHKHVHVKKEIAEVPINTTSCPSTRPTSLPLASSTLATGVAITTPSSVINTICLDSLVDHTGLTPLTGAPCISTGLTPLTSGTGLTPLTSGTGLTPLTSYSGLTPVTSGTGLTPITSGPSNCSSDHRNGRSPTERALHSPTLMAL